MLFSTDYGLSEPPSSPELPHLTVCNNKTYLKFGNNIWQVDLNVKVYDGSMTADCFIQLPQNLCELRLLYVAN